MLEFSPTFALTLTKGSPTFDIFVQYCESSDADFELPWFCLHDNSSGNILVN